MTRWTANRRHLAAAGLLVLACAVAACGGATSSATPPAGSAASSAAASGSTSGAGAAIADPLLGVKIGAPYTLTELPPSKADTIQAGIEKDLGAFGKAVHVGVRSIDQAGKPVAYLMVVAFPRGTLNDNIYGQVITDLSMGAEADFTPKLISNVPVSFGTLSGGSVAVFRTGDLVMVTLSPTPTDLTPVVSALVSANG